MSRLQRRISAATAMVLSAAVLASCGGSPSTGSSQASSALPAIRYQSHLAAGGDLPSGVVLLNPKKAGDEATIKAGETLFAAMNCDGCHGGGGGGWVGPSLADGRWRYGGADAEVFFSIYYGRPKGMPAFGGKLGSDGVWTLVTYLKSLPVPPEVATESWVTR